MSPEEIEASIRADQKAPQKPALPQTSIPRPERQQHPPRRASQPSSAWTGGKPQKNRPRSDENGADPTDPPLDIHRAPPHSVEAEQGVLGSMLISPREAIAECVEKINEEYFYVPCHQTIYTVLVDLWNTSQAIDLITFTQVLRDRNLLDSVGGPAFVTSLFTFVPTAANIEYYLDILRDKYLLRQIIAGGTEAVRRAFEEQDEVNLLVDEIEQRFIGIGDDRYQTQASSMKENVMRAIDQISDAYERKGALIGIGTGIPEFDRMTGGLRAAEMIVIAARPSMGKTALCMNIAEHAAVNDGRAVGVFSLEMSTDQLVQRLICSRARVNLQKVRDGFLAERDFPSMTAAASKLAGSKIFIDDASALSILELRAKARRMRSQFHVELIVIDYLQLLRSLSKRRDDNRQIEVSEISSGIKSLTKELQIPIVVAAQLNRQPEARHGGKPRLSDLRESGSIEQDADLVGLLYRPEMYEEDEELRHEMSGEAELIIAKQRNGPVGEIPLTFLKEFTRFESRARNVDDSGNDLF